MARQKRQWQKQGLPAVSLQQEVIFVIQWSFATRTRNRNLFHRQDKIAPDATGNTAGDLQGTLAMSFDAYQLGRIVVLDGTLQARSALAHAEAVVQAFSAPEDEVRSLITGYTRKHLALTSTWAIKVMASWKDPDSNALLWQLVKDPKLSLLEMTTLDHSLATVDGGRWRASPSRSDLLRRLCASPLTPDNLDDVLVYLNVELQLEGNLSSAEAEKLLLALIHNETIPFDKKSQICQWPHDFIERHSLSPADAFDFWLSLLTDPTKHLYMG